MQKRILLATDFSISSWKAIQYAIKLYENQECDFYILNTYGKDVYGLDSYALLDPDEAFNKLSENQSKEGLGDILIKLSRNDKNLKHCFHLISRSERFLDAVKILAVSLQIDMVVMGAKGITNKRKGKYGENTLGIIESIRKCPVLVVPKNAVFDQPEEIVLACNFNTDFDISEVKHLFEIAKMNNSSVRILSLTDNEKMTVQQKKNKALIQKHLKGIDHDFNVLHDVKMSSALSCFIEIKDSNMISYVDKKPSVWETLGFGKTSLGKLGYFKDIPVLALHG
ncbi:universal stress protein [Maribacter sp. PR1]|uniref:Universal stress protein n=1 Tax=Maribacter cobaltidurans TaxID=1178778 RepID=A0ABU7IXZ5_9FLAO|nr:MULTISPECIES: universal stress protein [Maribacter]MDC6390456.1 universal stress protein [Maribacter sp. PR1]MEE1977845.1 universal stress protein [Maribacter cobaltidurans]